MQHETLAQDSLKGSKEELRSGEELFPKDNMQFYSHFISSLTENQYRISLKSTLTGDLQLPPDDSPDLKTIYQSFTVPGSLFTLPGEDIHAQSPPPFSTGPFKNQLPHIIFNKRSLPWECKIDEKQPIPWVALLVCTEKELNNVPPGDQKLDNVGKFTATVGDLFKSETNIIKPDLESITEAQKSNPCCFIRLPARLFTALIPKIEELALLTHYRKVSSQGKDSEFYSVVVSNRFPQPPKDDQKPLKYCAHLVSLTGCKSYINKIPDDKIIQLVSLTSWSFHCSAEPNLRKHFSILMSDIINQTTPSASPMSWLDPQLPLLRILPELKDQSDLDSPTLKRMADGYVPLTYETRTGEKTLSWYRGPLTPGEQSLISTFNSLNKLQSDSFLIYDSSQGIFDTSYAAAWQIGQALAFADSHFTQRLIEYRWQVHRQTDSVAHRQSHEMKTIDANISVRQHMVNRLKEGLLHEIKPKSASSPDHKDFTTPVEDFKPRAHLIKLSVDERINRRREILSENLETPYLSVVVEWIKALRKNLSLPFNYLVPQEKQLPNESIRFFHVDPNWLKMLTLGALSIGVHSKVDQDLNDSLLTQWEEEKIFQATDPLCGMLLRSVIISSLPGLYIRLNEDGQTDTTPMVLRQDCLSEDVLLCLWSSLPTTVAVYEPHEQIGFGLEINTENPNGYIALRDISGTTPGNLLSPKTEIPLPFRNEYSVLDMATLNQNVTKELKQKGINTASGVDLNSAEMAIELIRVPEKALFSDLNLNLERKLEIKETKEIKKTKIIKKTPDISEMTPNPFGNNPKTVETPKRIVKFPQKFSLKNFHASKALIKADDSIVLHWDAQEIEGCRLILYWDQNYINGVDVTQHKSYPYHSGSLLEPKYTTTYTLAALVQGNSQDPYTLQTTVTVLRQPKIARFFGPISVLPGKSVELIFDLEDRKLIDYFKLFADTHELFPIQLNIEGCRGKITLSDDQAPLNSTTYTLTGYDTEQKKLTQAQTQVKVIKSTISHFSSKYILQPIYNFFNEKDSDRFIELTWTAEHIDYFNLFALEEKFDPLVAKIKGNQRRLVLTGNLAPSPEKSKIYMYTLIGYSANGIQIARSQDLLVNLQEELDDFGKLLNGINLNVHPTPVLLKEKEKFVIPDSLDHSFETKRQPIETIAAFSSLEESKSTKLDYSLNCDPTPVQASNEEISREVDLIFIISKGSADAVYVQSIQFTIPIGEDSTALTEDVTGISYNVSSNWEIQTAISSGIFTVLPSIGQFQPVQSDIIVQLKLTTNQKMGSSKILITETTTDPLGNYPSTATTSKQIFKYPQEFSVKNFHASSANIQPGEKITLYWDIEAIKDCTLTLYWDNNPTKGIDVTYVSAYPSQPKYTTTYTLKAQLTGNPNDPYILQTTVTVMKPQITYFYGPLPISPGERVPLSFNIINTQSSDYCSVFAGLDRPIIAKFTCDKNEQLLRDDQAPQTNTTYTLVVYNSEGKVQTQSQARVIVVKPSISHFVSEPAQAFIGETLTLRWEASNIDSLALFNFKQQFNPIVSKIDPRQRKIILADEQAPEVSTTYTLIGYDKKGEPIVRSQDLFVQLYKSSMQKDGVCFSFGSAEDLCCFDLDDKNNCMYYGNRSLHGEDKGYIVNLSQTPSSYQPFSLPSTQGKINFLVVDHVHNCLYAICLLYDNMGVVTGSAIYHSSMTELQPPSPVIIPRWWKCWGDYNVTGSITAIVLDETQGLIYAAHQDDKISYIGYDKKRLELTRKSPSALANTPSSLYVADRNNDTVFVVDTKTWDIVGQPIKVGKAPSALALDMIKKHLYVANSHGDSVSVIDISFPTPIVINSVRTGENPRSLALDMLQSILYVYNIGDNTVSAISIKQQKILYTITMYCTTFKYLLDSSGYNYDPNLIEIFLNNSLKTAKGKLYVASLNGVFELDSVPAPESKPTAVLNHSSNEEKKSIFSQLRGWNNKEIKLPIKTTAILSLSPSSNIVENKYSSTQSDLKPTKLLYDMNCNPSPVQISNDEISREVQLKFLISAPPMDSVFVQSIKFIIPIGIGSDALTAFTDIFTDVSPGWKVQPTSGEFLVIPETENYQQIQSGFYLSLTMTVNEKTGSSVIGITEITTDSWGNNPVTTTTSQCVIKYPQEFMLSNLRAVPANIQLGETTQIAWDVQGIKGCTLTLYWDDIEKADVTGRRSSYSLTPTHNTTVILKATFPGNDQDPYELQITVTVMKPTIVDFFGPTPISPGKETALTFFIKNARPNDYCRLFSNDNDLILDEFKCDKSLVVIKDNKAPQINTTYTLVLYDLTSTILDQAQTTVIVMKPHISNFLSEPVGVLTGTDVRLRWESEYIDHFKLFILRQKDKPIIEKINGKEKECLLTNDLCPQRSTTYTLIGYNEDEKVIAISLDLFVQVYKKSRSVNSDYPILNSSYNKLYLNSTINRLCAISSKDLTVFDISHEPPQIIGSPLKLLDSAICTVNSSKQCLYFSNNSEIDIIDIAQSPPEIKSSFRWHADSWQDNCPPFFSALDEVNNRLYMSNGSNRVSIVDIIDSIKLKVTSFLIDQTEAETSPNAHQLIVDSERHRLYIAMSCNWVSNGFIYIVDTSKNPPSKVDCIDFSISVQNITSMILNRHEDDKSLYALAGISYTARVDAQQPSSRIHWISIQHQLTNLVLDEINELLYCFGSLIDSDIGIIAVVSANLKKLLYTIDMKSKVTDVVINNNGDLYVACENGISLCSNEVIPELDTSGNRMRLEEVADEKLRGRPLLKKFSNALSSAYKQNIFSSSSSSSSSSSASHTGSVISSSNPGLEYDVPGNSMMLAEVNDEKLKRIPPPKKGRRFFGDISKFRYFNSSSSSSNASHIRGGISSSNSDSKLEPPSVFIHYPRIWPHPKLQTGKPTDYPSSRLQTEKRAEKPAKSHCLVS